jgi:hypothetical protein
MSPKRCPSSRNISNFTVTKVDGLGSFEEVFERIAQVIDHGFKRIR